VDREAATGSRIVAAATSAMDGCTGILTLTGLVGATTVGRWYRLGIPHHGGSRTATTVGVGEVVG